MVPAAKGVTHPQPVSTIDSFAGDGTVGYSSIGPARFDAMIPGPRTGRYPYWLPGSGGLMLMSIGRVDRVLVMPDGGAAMNDTLKSVLLAAGTIVFLTAGCSAPKVDFSTIERPPRAEELDAYDVFVGSWDWKAEMIGVEGPDRMWTGRTEWEWSLDKRCLQGTMSAANPSAEFKATGIWSWHPKRGKYTWWMFNSWGYPQEGTAKYDTDDRRWEMPYKGVGLDGSASHGLYRMTVVNRDVLEWRMIEWADATRLIKKMEMRGTYTRRR